MIKFFQEFAAEFTRSVRAVLNTRR